MESKCAQCNLQPGMTQKCQRNEQAAITRQFANLAQTINKTKQSVKYEPQNLIARSLVFFFLVGGGGVLGG